MITKPKYIMFMLIISFFLLFLMPLEKNRVLFINRTDRTSEILCLKKNQILTIKNFNGEILKVIGDEQCGKYLFYLINNTDRIKDASVYIEINGDKINNEKIIYDYPVIFKLPYFYLNYSLFNSNIDKLYDLNNVLNCINKKLNSKFGILPKSTRIINVTDTGFILLANFVKTDLSKANSFPKKAFDKNYKVNLQYLSSDSIRKYFNAFVKFSIFYSDFRFNNIKLISEFNHYHANIFYYDNTQKHIYVYSYSSTEDPGWDFDKIFILNEKFNRINEIKLNGTYQYKPYQLFKYKNNIILLNPDSITCVKNNKLSNMNYEEFFDAPLNMELTKRKIKSVLF